MAILAGKGTAQTSQLGGGSGIGRDFLDLEYTVTQDGDIEDFDVAIVVGAVDIRLKVWRTVGLNKVFIGQSQTFSSLAAGVQNLVLASPISVLTGDIIDVWVAGNQGAVGVDTDLGSGIIFSDNTDYITTQPTSNFPTPLAAALSIQVNGTVTASDTVNITDIQTANQKNITTNTKSIDFSGTYSGTPTALARRVEYADNQETISDWATFDNSPSGEVFSDSVTVPASVRPINVLVRFTNDVGVNGTSNDFYVGDFVIIAGESTGEDMGTDGTGTPNTGVLDWNSATGTLSIPSTGAGQITLANTINTQTGHAIFINNVAVGGTALLAANNPSNYLWEATNPTSRAQYQAIVDTFNAAGDIPCLYFNIGANDAGVSATDKPTLTAAYTAFFAQLRVDTKVNLPIVASLTGRYLGVPASEQGWTDDTLAQKAAYDADINVHYTTFYDQGLKDTVHPDVAGYEETGRRMANAALSAVYGIPQPYRPPQITSVVRTSDTITTFNISRPEGSDITPTLNITDVALSADGFTSEVTISSVDRVGPASFAATHISAVVTDYRYNWGSAPNITGIVKDNSARTLPLLQAEGSVEEAAETSGKLTNGINISLQIGV